MAARCSTSKLKRGRTVPYVLISMLSTEGALLVSDINYGNADNLDKDAKETVDAVLEYYGDKSPQWLSDLNAR